MKKKSRKLKPDTDKTVTNKETSLLRRTRALILLFLIVSGSCGLVYEILWMKMLSLVTGNTVFSVTTVLTAFMGGLALGSFLAGRFEDRIRNPLRAYALMEGGIGIYALLLPFLIAGTEPFFRFVYQSMNPSFYTFSLLKFFVCGILLLAPTTLMGATLPVLSKHFVAKNTHVGWNVGLLYGLNTLGAVLGCALAGFVFIPALGVTWTIYGAAFLNIAIAVCVLKIAKKNIHQKTSEDRIAPKNQKGPVEKVVPMVGRSTLGVVMAGIGFSGIAAMIYQIAWTRVISLSIGSSVYAFSLIVTAFICGLALGSLIIAKFIDRQNHPIVLLALVQGAIGITALLIVPLLGRMPVFIAEKVFKTHHSFQYIHFMEFAIIFLLILLPTCMMGAAVPLAIKISTTDIRRVGRFFGNLYAVNTLGAIIGSFITGFLLIPYFGAQNSILIAVAINIFAAGLVLSYAKSISLIFRMSWMLLIAVIVVLSGYPVTKWDSVILTSGPYIYSSKYKKVVAAKGIDTPGAMKEGRELLFFKEGLHAIVSVKKSSIGEIMLDVNGKVDASAKADAGTQLMIGHLPLLIHPEASDVLVIGLASGMTLGAVEKHPVKAVDIVEIEPAMVEACYFFREFNGDPLNDPRTNLILGDGRNHLALTRQKYDVIASEPSNPWISGNANLFTKEFFTLAKNRLRKGGVMCVWIQAYSMFSRDFKSIVKTFHTVFPHVSLWEVAIGADYILIGTMEELPVDLEVFKTRLNKMNIKSDLKKMNLETPVAFMNKLIITEKEIPQYTFKTPIHTDNNALIEYSAPKGFIKGQSIELMQELYKNQILPGDLLLYPGWIQVAAAVSDSLPGIFEAKKSIVSGLIHYALQEESKAIKMFEKALTENPDDYDAVHWIATVSYNIAKKSKRMDKSLEAYEKGIKVVDDFIGGNITLLSDHFTLEGIYAKANLDLGNIYMNANRLEDAKKAFEKCIAAGGRLVGGHSNLGIVHVKMGNYGDAVKQFNLAIDQNPDLISAHINLGNTFLNQKKYRDAVRSYQNAQKLNPGFAPTYNNLGLAYYQLGQWDMAEKQWMHALKLKPDFKKVQKRLHLLRKKMNTQ